VTDVERAERVGKGSATLIYSRIASVWWGWKRMSGRSVGGEPLRKRKARSHGEFVPFLRAHFPGQARLLTSQIRSSDCAIAARQVEKGMGETKAKNSTR